MVAIGADEKKKIFILLGLAGVLGAVVIFVIKPFGGSKSADDAGASSPDAALSSGGSSAPATPVSSAGSGAPPSASSASSTSAPAGGVVPVSSVPPGYRSDPFMPKWKPAGPRIIVLPPPPPPPLPLVIPGPGPRDLPPASLDPAVLAARQPLSLPPVSIPQYKPRGEPRLAAPGTGGPGGGVTSRTRATDRRLAGVVIGDSVRALLEISDGEQTVTHVVKPGDEFQGIKILRIDRVTENGVTVTRMTVQENGQERFFDLRPSSNPPANGGGPGEGFGGNRGGGSSMSQ